MTRHEGTMVTQTDHRTDHHHTDHHHTAHTTCHLHRVHKFQIIMALAVIMLLTMTFNISSYTVGYVNSGLDDNAVLVTQTDKDAMNKSDEQVFEGSKTIHGIKKLRILCLIMTMEKDLNTKVDAVNKTWAKRCHKHYYIISSKQKRHDFLNVNVPDNRHSLIDKMKMSFKFIYDNHLNDFDYLLKADDDTYVIIENLQFLMSFYPSSEPGYLGFHFNKFVPTGYMSGGAGYVITNRGLRHLIERGYNKNLCAVVHRAEDKENSEDIETGRCLETAGVPRLSSLDSEGKETFHPYTLHQHLFNGIPGYVYSWAKNKVGQGKGCCSRYSISFHYMTPDAMFYTDHLLYDTSVFGISDKKRTYNDVFRIGKV